MEQKRRYERVAFYCPVELTVLPDGATVSGSSFDISLGGVGVTAGAFLERGRSVSVRFHLKDASHREVCESVMGRVAYSMADEDGNRIGIEFLETIGPHNQPRLAERLNNM